GVQNGDFVDQDGRPLPKWEAYLGRMKALANHEAKVSQLPGADLRNFTEVINHYARMVGALSGLPPHFLGLSTDQPASADAIRSSEARLVKRAERRARMFGEAWEQAMRIAMRIAGRDEAGAERLETIWRDPSTPTVAARADAVTKLVQSGILPVEAAWEELGYSSERRRRLRDMQSSDPVARYMAAAESLRAENPGQGEPAPEGEAAGPRSSGLGSGRSSGSGCGPRSPRCSGCCGPACPRRSGGPWWRPRIRRCTGRAWITGGSRSGRTARSGNASSASWAR